MTAAKSILTISRDQPLQSTRTAILQQAGYAVSAAMNDKDAIGLRRGPEFPRPGSIVSFRSRSEQDIPRN